jgi:hypothetical protein
MKSDERQTETNKSEQKPAKAFKSTQAQVRASNDDSKQREVRKHVQTHSKAIGDK